MGSHHINDAHHAVLVNDSHLGQHTVDVAAVNGDEVVGLGDAVADDVRHDKVILAQCRLAQRIRSRKLMSCQLFTQLNHFHLQQGIALLEALVDVVQVEIGSDAVKSLIDRSAHAVGRCQINALLVGVVLKQQHEAQNHIDSENEPRTVFDKKIEQIVHRMSLQLSAFSF